MKVGRSARELNAITKRVADNALRSLGWRNLTICEVEFELTCDRCTVYVRNLSVSQGLVTGYANLQNACEVIQRETTLSLSVAVHHSCAICEGTLGVALLISEYHLALARCRVSHCVRVVQYAVERECCNRRIASDSNR